MFISEQWDHSWLYFFIILLQLFSICEYFSNAHTWFVVLTLTKNYIENNNNKNQNKGKQNPKKLNINNTRCDHKKRLMFK